MGSFNGSTSFMSYSCSLFLLLVFTISVAAQSNFNISEDAFRANNRGVGLLEQFKSDEAETEFRRALALKPDIKLAKINLAIALFDSKKSEEARSVALDFLNDEPNSPVGHYVLGLIERSANRTDEAFAHFQRVLAIDPEDVGANVNVGQILIQQGKLAQAIKHFETAYKTESYNLTAIYNLAIALRRTGASERAAELFKKFQTLRDSNAGTSIGLNYLEQGRYAEAMTTTGIEGEIALPTDKRIYFQEVAVGVTQKRKFVLPKATANSRTKVEFLKSHAGGAALFDFDGDGDLDLVKLNNTISTAGKTPTVVSGFTLYRSERGKFVDVTRVAGDLVKIHTNESTAVIPGDFDNDNMPDLLVVRVGEIQLLRNAGRGRFVDVSADAKLPRYSFVSASAAFVDADHDGDLDIFVAGFSPVGDSLSAGRHLLLRNNGDRTFTDISVEAKINQTQSNAVGQAVAVVPTDFDNRRDIDLLVLNNRGEPHLLSNQRDTSFRDVAAATGLKQTGEWTCVAAGDFNKDSFVDFYFGRNGAVGVFAISDGRGKFELKDAPAGTENTSAAQFFDYDNDGLLDLIAATGRGLVLSRNLGKSWLPAEANIFRTTDNNALGNARHLLSGDVDADGDIDLFVIGRSGEIVYLQNSGGNSNNSSRLRLLGRVSNRTGVGAKVSLRSGSLAQQLETYAASPNPAPSEVHFGLGKREKPDSIRVLWSSGIVQSETDIAEPTAKNRVPLTLQELDRKPSSCPYLYTWNGEKFEFITDFLGGGEMGSWAGKGVYNYPDSDEFVRIPPGKLKARDGFYELRVTNELEEVMYLDHIKLVAVEHDADTEVFPNEGLGSSQEKSEPVITVRNARPPLVAVNSDGQDVLPKVRDLDRTFYNDFTSRSIRGYAETHSITLALDDKLGYNGPTILLLTGWTDYAFSSDNLAAAQSGKSLFMPYLQVKDDRGEWQTVIDSIGIPIGRPQTLTVDLTGKFLSPAREVRIVTNFKTYWDKIAVDTPERSTKLRTIDIAPVNANLRERGFSEETSFGGMIVPDYERVGFDERWKRFAGRFTRLGDVRALLSEPDDTFVISKTGDELVLNFPALPSPQMGKTYTFLLFADGYSKEMDINSGSPDAVFPLPFKKMTTYPYGPDERYPMTDERRRIYEETLTRFSRGGVSKN